MSKKGAEVKAKQDREEKPQQKVMYSVSDDSAAPKTGERQPRPLSFGKIVLRLAFTTVFLSVIALASIVLTYYVAHKGGVAHEAVDYIVNNHMAKKEVPKQMKLFSFLMIAVAFFHTFASHLVTLISKQVSLRKGINFGAPRSQVNDLTGLTARASAAHLNAHEAFPGFAAAVIVAVLAGVQPVTVATLSLTFIAFRTVYYPAYWFNIPPARTLVWLGGWFTTAALFLTILYPSMFDATPQQWLGHLKETFPQYLEKLNR